MNYWVLAFYKFISIVDPKEEIRLQKEFLSNGDFTSRIYISESGINGQMCGSEKDAKAYIEWMSQRDPFKEMPIKIQKWHEQAFPKLSVKYRKLLGFDASVDISDTAPHVSPQEWKKMIEEGEAELVLDVRNDYESQVGYFEGSERPKCNTFRDFQRYTQELEDTRSKDATILMCCTGGIRCEVYSAYLKQKGFKRVFQLDGGIINYGNQVGNALWKGKLFVFDDRLTVPISDAPGEVVGKCRHCQTPIERYHNCANMDCNDLFLCCKECLTLHKGCCQTSCEQAPRVRALPETEVHKPFRRLSQQEKLSLVKTPSSLSACQTTPA